MLVREEGCVTSGSGGVAAPASGSLRNRFYPCMASSRQLAQRRGLPMEGVAGTASRARSLSDWIWRDAAQAAQINIRASEPCETRGRQANRLTVHESSGVAVDRARLEWQRTPSAGCLGECCDCVDPPGVCLHDRSDTVSWAGCWRTPAAPLRPLATCASAR